MTREEFNQLLHAPEQAALLPKDAISTLVEQFPYCQPLRSLYLLQLHRQNSISYDQQLKVTAAFAPDRSRLYQLIHPAPAFAASEEQEPIIASPLAETVVVASTVDSGQASALPATDQEIAGLTLEEELPLNVEELVNERLRELNIPIEIPEPQVPVVQVETFEPEDHYTLPESADVEAGQPTVAEENVELMPVTAQAAIPAPEQASEPDPIDLLVQENLVHATAETIILEPSAKSEITEDPGAPALSNHQGLMPFSAWLKVKSGKEKSFTPDSSQRVPTPVKSSTEVKDAVAGPREASVPVQHSGPKAGEIRPEMNEAPTSIPRLIYLKGPNDAPPVPAIEKIASPLVPDSHLAFIFPQKDAHSTIRPTSNENPDRDSGAADNTRISEPIFIPARKPIPDPSLVDTDPPKAKVPANELIDKFIEQEPRITPSKSAFYSPVNMAKRSIQETEDIITETLANIYAQQGNFQKAIQFYEKLSLKFPEKSRYFAALISDLTKKINP